MVAARLVGLGVAVVMAGAIIYGLVSGGFADDASAIWALPWGRVSIVDIYAGLVLFGAWIALREAKRAHIALWWAALLVLGNLAAGVYLVRATMLSRDTRELLMGEAR